MTELYCHIDFETYYKSGEYSVKDMHPWAYINDPRFDAYMVSLKTAEWSYVGPVEKAPWDKVAQATVLGAHNVNFDQLVLERLQREGKVPAFRPVEWVDTADLAVYLKYPRYLEGVCKLLYGHSPDKKMRKRMDGKRLVDARAGGYEKELLAYCLSDSEYAFRLWTENSKDWPAVERKISRINRESSMRGMRIDWAAAEAAKYSLEEQRHAAERKIPWMDHCDTPLSIDELRAEARKVGLDVPASLDQRNPAAKAWMAKYAPQYPWLQAVRDWRRLNTFCSKINNLLDGRRPDGTFMFESRYMGAAATGRFAGGVGENADSDNRFNVYNLAKKPVYGVDFRGLIIPDPGHILFVYDWAQIEARLLLWRVGDKDMLEMARRYDLYEAYARSKQGYADPRPLAEVNNELRQCSKTTVLGCGYQCGPEKHKETCAGTYDRHISLDQAKEEVYGFREANPLIVNHWGRHQMWLGVACDSHHCERYDIPLRSGRTLSYFNLARELVVDKRGRVRPEYKASVVRGGSRTKLYGGKMTENEIQATARDILRDAWAASHDAGYPFIWTVYDETIGQVPIDKQEQAAKELPEILCHSSEWAKDCPLNVGGKFLQRYKKI